ncbi:peroxiredoxin [Methanosarcina mazei]|jgi:peroxiredoxin|uniref:Thioredoxin peroxidase n=5 Tax=Methanosarcina mazei TaxID=2209 RepID=A0A0F8MF46_METMZ|nr:peroxiredoxin [Methanosarcina mazei]AAM31472.1 Thiol-specific antioxidant protein [Methanosarcina mazei Go1]AGF97194.1 Alkyl hydroperoxide reductase subunit C-like protein [Methanosarcina mazei Tuc01]AKB66100.1 Alkyl hydroperoxide reductase subunit C-like protein [Methanosarcina mazei S-6]AKB68771.1 Alkyl hydroperoxide reductase subunit C-like protein [Methanosarcina mazei LYC]KKG84681.1 thioredoxin peroxidase [Methanosarcina mazei]
MTDEIRVGETIQDFRLRDQKREEIHLYDLKGKKVLLSFHPLAWTQVCAQQMKSLEENYELFTELNTVPLGISVDPIPSKKAWARELGINHIKLLSDFWPHGEVARTCGIFRGKEGVSERANIIIDENRQVIYFKKYLGHELPDIKEIIEVLKNK